MNAPHTSKWEIVHDEPHDRVRRMAVPGGWIYQVELAMVHEPGVAGEASASTHGWTAPVLVPEVRS